MTTIVGYHIPITKQEIKFSLFRWHGSSQAPPRLLSANGVGPTREYRRGPDRALAIDWQYNQV